MPTIALTPIPAGEMKRAPLNVWAADIQAAVNALDGTNFGAGAVAATHVLRARVSGDSDQRLAIQADGKLLWGSGAAGGDVNLYRGAADVLQTDDAIKVGATARIHIKPTAEIQFGDAAGVLDTNIYRNAADTLKTDDEFVVGLNRGSATESPLYLNVNGTVKRVDIGAADSAGAGFKLLKVAN
jgi:hypothetical protein